MCVHSQPEGIAMTKKLHDTPNLDQLESGPWPSFVTGFKRLAEDKPMMADLLGQLEHSYQNIKGYWKGGTVTVRGYGGRVPYSACNATTRDALRYRYPA